MRDLNQVLPREHGISLDGWFLYSATGVSADGMTIVGFGAHDHVASVAWIATIPGGRQRTNTLRRDVLAVRWLPARETSTFCFLNPANFPKGHHHAGKSKKRTLTVSGEGPLGVVDRWTIEPVVTPRGASGP